MSKSSPTPPITPAASPQPPPTHSNSECERDRRQLLRDNKILSKQVADFTRDIEDLKAQVRIMAEAPSNEVEVKRMIDRAEAALKRSQQVSLNQVREEISGLGGRHTSLEAKVDDLTNKVTLVEAAQASIAEQLEVRYAAHLQLAEKVADMEKEAGIPQQPQSQSVRAIHLLGLNDLRRASSQMLPENADPTEVIRCLLQHVNMEQHLERILLFNTTTSEAGRSARSALIYMTSAFHKGEAIIRIKATLAKHRMWKVAVEDCFPASEMETVRRMKAFGLHQKAKGEIYKFRVVNREGKPVLQAGETALGKFTDLRVPTSYTTEATEAARPRREDGDRGRREERSTVAADPRPQLADSQQPPKAGGSRQPPAAEGRERPAGGSRAPAPLLEWRRQEPTRDQREDRERHQGEQTSRQADRRTVPYSSGRDNGDGGNRGSYRSHQDRERHGKQESNYYRHTDMHRYTRQ